MALNLKKDMNTLKKIFEQQGFSKEVVSSILGNIEVESGFRCKTESLYYTTVQRLREVFPSKFKGQPDSFVDDYIKDEEGLGNYVYKQYGGFKFRGRGYIQITTKANYEYFGKVLGLPLVEKPELAATPEISALIASRFIKDHAFPLSKLDLNKERNLIRVATLVAMAVQGPRKDYSKGFLKKHLDAKVLASQKFFKIYDSI